MTIRDGKGSRAAKAKGRDAENAVVAYLRERGIPAERRRLTGVADCGDIAGWEGVVCEVKNEKRIDLAGYMKELEAERRASTKRFGMWSGRNALTGGCVGVVVIKKRGTSDAGQWYALMPFSQAVELMR